MTHEPTAHRARRRGLNLPGIVRAATEIADADGIDALSMRRVADRLGHGVMSLYRHVPDKDQLVALVIDGVFGEEPFPEHPPSGWRPRLHASAHRQWRCYERHPWIASVVTIARPRLGSNGVREMEWAFEGLAELPVTDAERLRIYLIVTAYVHGAAGQRAAETLAARASGMDTRQWWAAQAATRSRIFAGGQFPLVARLGRGADPSPEAWFETGLTALLDGLELQLARTE